MLTLKNHYQSGSNRDKRSWIRKSMADSSPNWFDKNKFKNILAIIDSKKFGCKNKIAEFKYIDNEDLVINIKNNTIS